MKKGLFITFEGPDGSGKTTQISQLETYLKEKGFDAVLTREPGGTAISETIREIILDKNNREMDDRTEALLYAASRAQHVAQVIIPSLKEGKMVICDRFMDSSIVYQGVGRGLGDDVRIINEFAVQGIAPDVTFLLKVDPEVGKGRIKEEHQDRLELEKIEYHNRVFRGYMELAERNKNRIIVIDAEGTVEEIAKTIRQRMDLLLEGRTE